MIWPQYTEPSEIYSCFLLQTIWKEHCPNIRIRCPCNDTCGECLCSGMFSVTVNLARNKTKTVTTTARTSVLSAMRWTSLNSRIMASWKNWQSHSSPEIAWSNKVSWKLRATICKRNVAPRPKSH
jgi:hypothetical protein